MALLAFATIAPLGMRAALAGQGAGPAGGRGGAPAPGRGGQAPVAQTGTGLVLAQVVDGATGAAIPDAIVTVSAQGNAPAAGRGRGGQAPNRQLLSGRDGRVAVRNLPIGPVALGATADGYIPGSVGQTRPRGPLKPVVLADGERVRDVKIRLWKYSALSGSVSNELGEPAVGVTMRAFARRMVTGRVHFDSVSTTRTDDRGAYRFGSLEPGDYIVAAPQTVATLPTSNVDSVLQSLASGAGVGDLGTLASMSSAMGASGGGSAVTIGGLRVSSSLPIPIAAAGARQFAYRTQYFPNASEPDGASAVKLASGEERTGLDFGLALAPTSRVSGVVTAPPGSATNAMVRLLPVGLEQLGSDAGMETATVLVSNDGAFTLVGVPPGQYVAKIEKRPAPGLPAALASNAFLQLALGDAARTNPGAPVAPPLYAQALVAVGADDIRDVTLALAEGVHLSGRIVFEGATPPPAASPMFTITLGDALGRVSAPDAGAPPAGPDGRFQTSSRAPGRYFVQGPATAAWIMRSVIVGGRNVLDQAVDFQSDVADAVVTYTDKVATLSGTVRATGATSDSDVILFPSDFRAWFDSGMNPRRARRTTSSNGAYSIALLLGGDYLVAATDDADAIDMGDPAFFEALARGATHVTLTDGERKTQDLSVVKVAR